MTTERLTQWANLAKIITVLVSIVAFLLGSGFFWNHVWSIPNLVYTILPSYGVGGRSFGGFVVENRGRAAAHGVLIKVIDLGANIEALEIKSDEAVVLQKGGQGAQTIEVWLDRIVPRSSLTIYVLTNQDISLEDHISITAEEGRGVPASSEDPGSRTTFIFLVTALVAFVLSSSGITLFSINRFRAREMEREVRKKLDDARMARAVRQAMYNDVLQAVARSELDDESKKEFIRLAFETSQKVHADET